MDKRKLFIDYDSTIVNSIKRICQMYNHEYVNHPKFKPAVDYLVEKWDFTDQLKLAPKGLVTYYFNRKDFFDEKLEFMENAEEIIHKLSEKFDIYVPSLGNDDNLYYKERWLQEKLPFVKFIGCNFDDVEDKKHIDMSGGILIDDCTKNLDSSNAELKICYGDLYDWNKDWQGKRCWNWYEVLDYLLA
jgi:5'(3')-deoxyribonucleotidase